MYFLPVWRLTNVCHLGYVVLAKVVLKLLLDLFLRSSRGVQRCCDTINTAHNFTWYNHIYWVGTGTKIKQPWIALQFLSPKVL